MRKLEGMGLDAEREVTQDLRPEAVAQAHILESDHVKSLKAPGPQPLRNPAAEAPV